MLLQISRLINVVIRLNMSEKFDVFADYSPFLKTVRSDALNIDKRESNLKVVADRVLVEDYFERLTLLWNILSKNV